jgi:probable addiction module antidote protein
MSKPTYRTFSEYNREQLTQPEDARLYLELALEAYEEDGDKEAFLMALRDVAEAHGGLSRLAKETSLSRQSLHKALSGKGNPRLDTLGAILHGLGFRLSIEHRNA